VKVKKVMSVKDLKKALEQKAKTLAELNKQCRHTWRVCKDCMAHCEFKDTEQFKVKWLSLEDVEAFLVELFLEKVIVPRKQFFDKCAYVDFEGKPAIVCNLCRFYHGLQKGCSWEEEKKELLEAQK
jgi:hypothetical protein